MKMFWVKTEEGLSYLFRATDRDQALKLFKEKHPDMTASEVTEHVLRKHSR